MIDEIEFNHKNNIKKFELLGELFQKAIDLSCEDYQLLLTNDHEVSMYFLTDYSFKDVIQNEKFNILKEYLIANINNCKDEYEFDDLLDVCDRVKYYDILEILNLDKLCQNNITTVLNFIENNYSKIQPSVILKLLNEINSLSVEGVNKFIVTYNLGLIENKFLSMAETMYAENDSTIITRVANNNCYYHLLLKHK